MNPRVDQSSFRDPGGFVFFNGTNCYRAIRNTYSSEWDQVLRSGLYQELAAEGHVIQLTEYTAEPFFPTDKSIYKVYSIQRLPFISYPPEWSFNQLKKAALLTLAIQKRCIQKGFVLKDASAYNVQFIGNKAIFIDSLSFETLQENRPWQAYGQFCRHFLAPLLLDSYGYSELRSLSLNYVDGIPLTLCSKLLPWYSRISFFAATHIHWHAKMESKHAHDRELKKQDFKYSKSKLIALIEHLEMGIRELNPKNSVSHWSNYYESFSYSVEGYRMKQDFVNKYCEILKGKLCLDLGANSGVFSLIASKHFEQVLACDSDSIVLHELETLKTTNILCLRSDLSNPLPGYGWNSTERKSFIERAKDNDLTLALALVHHLCIAQSISLRLLAEFFASVSKSLIIEFIPKSDDQVKKLLVSRKDVYPDYTQENFEMAFLNYFEKEEEFQLPDSGRVLYYFKRHSGYA